MTSRLLRIGFILSWLAIVSPVAAATIYAGETLAHDYAWQRDESGHYRLELAGGRLLNVTDQADLPGLDLLLLVPTDVGIVDITVEPLSVRTESIPGPLAVAKPLDGSNGAIVENYHLESVDGTFPATWGQFGGLHTWCGYRLLAVNLHPLRVVERDGQRMLEVLESYEIHTVVDGNRTPEAPVQRERMVDGERERLASSLQQMVANPEQVGSYARNDGIALDKNGGPFLPTPTPQLDGSAVSFLIVTTAELASEFQRLADYRTAQGLPSLVVTCEWIAANFRQGVDFQETMRFFLQDAYSKWGTEFLLIGGDTDIVPTRYAYSEFYPFLGHTNVPTDLYFAALDGTWAGDGDGYFGEHYFSAEIPGDDADLAPELAVGRAPVRSVVETAQFIDKLIHYDETPAGASWANNVLFVAEVLFPSDWQPDQGATIVLDGCSYAENLIDELVVDCTSMEYWRMYETDEICTYDQRLSHQDLFTQLDSGNWSQVHQFGHGHFFNMSVGDAQFTVADALALTNENHFMLFALNCASGAFDLGCLLERFVQNPVGGAIMSIGAAREAFPTNSANYQKRAYEYMACERIYRTVVALNQARLDFIANAQYNTVDRWTQLNATVIGDPTTSVWFGAPAVVEIDAPTSLAAGEQTVPVTISVGGIAVPFADVCLRRDNETYAFGKTDLLGQVALDVIPRTAGDMTLTVSGMGLARTSISIPVSGTSSYLTLTGAEIDDSDDNNNGHAEAGEVLLLSLTFEDVGGGGAGDLIATISSDDPTLQVLTASASMPDCTPGGTTTTTTPVIVELLDTASDGTAIPVRVEVTSGGGGSWVSPLLLDVRAPEVVVVRLEILDEDGDGTPESGERLILRPYVKNYGSGQVDLLTALLTDPAPGVTIDGFSASYAALNLLEEATYSSGELSLTLADIETAAACVLRLEDNHGRVITQTLQFTQLSAPQAPEIDSTLAADALVLRWGPLTESNVLGYNVYRSETDLGPFLQVNPDILIGMSYYEDSGLEQLTYYWYKVTAVDSFMVETEYSEVAVQTTTPAEVANFPLPFADPTSGHPAVGDVDGDGDLEIVLASDEVYVWNHDGTEILDGDHDPQTTGPLTDVGGIFQPSGVALANLDGEAGLEIIVGERRHANEIHIYRADGTMLPGWPRTLVSSYNWGSPSIGDVDGDGDPEVVVNDVTGRTYVWHHDGTELLDGDDNPATDGVFARRSGENWGLGSPALYDLDYDGAQDIIIGTRYDTGGGNQLLAYRYTGDQVSGFPYTFGLAIANCSPAVGDLDWDGDAEIVFFTTSDRLHVVQSDGSAYPGFPINGADPVYDYGPVPSPAIGNFDGDNDLEIVWPRSRGLQSMELLVIDTDVSGGTSGDVLPGWPVTLPANTEGSPVVGDIDGDGQVDIIQPIGNPDTETPDRVYAYNASGQPVAGFPIGLDGHCRSTPVICDIEDDGDVDIVYGAWDNLLHIWDMPAAYDPLTVPWPTFQGSMARDGGMQLGNPTTTEGDLPTAFTVLPPRPNPFNPTTTIRLYVAPGADTQLDVGVYDLRGRRIRRIHHGSAQPGWVEFTWDGRDGAGRSQASGVYFVQARQALDARTFKMTLVK